MKRPYRFHPSLRGTALGAVSALLLGTLAGTFNARAADSGSTSPNFVDFAGGGASVSGDTAAFQHRFDMTQNGFGGIDAFHYENYYKNDVSLVANGHALIGNHDYLVNIKISKDGVGFLNFGYSTFRVWYDGNGGYFSPNNLTFAPVSNDMYIDRSDLWFAFGITPQTGPQFKFRYDYMTRKGMTDSTSWADTNLTGGYGTRNIVPSYWAIDEHRSVIDATLWQDTAKTDWTLNAHYEGIKVDNALNEHRRPDESASRYVTQDNVSQPDIFATHGSIEHQLTNQLKLTAGAAYFSLDTTFSGSRIYGANYDPIYDPLFSGIQRYDEGFINLSGRSEMHQSTANLSLMYQPTSDWTIVPSLLAEKINWDANSSFTSTNSVGGPIITDGESADSNQNLRDLTGSIEARYTGIKNFVFIAKGELLGSYGTLNQDLYEVATGDDTDFRTTDYRRNQQKLSLTGCWYPRANLSYTVQYYYKGNQNAYVTPRDSVTLGSGYPGLIAHEDFTTNDANVRVTWRATPQLSFITRYDFQQSTIHTQQIDLAFIESSDMKTNIISETATWNPLMRWYLQGSVNVVYDQLKTPASQLTGNALNEVLNSDNNYVNGSFSTGYAIDDKSDVSLTYTYYHADNYVDNSQFSVPFGQGSTEHYVSVTFSRRVTPQLKYAVTCAYADGQDATSGGNNNYHGGVFYGNVQYRF